MWTCWSACWLADNLMIDSPTLELNQGRQLYLEIEACRVSIHLENCSWMPDEDIPEHESVHLNFLIFSCTSRVPHHWVKSSHAKWTRSITCIHDQIQHGVMYAKAATPPVKSTLTNDDTSRNPPRRQQVVQRAIPAPHSEVFPLQDWHYFQLSMHARGRYQEL